MENDFLDYKNELNPGFDNFFFMYILPISILFRLTSICTLCLFYIAKLFITSLHVFIIIASIVYSVMLLLLFFNVNHIY